MTYHSPAGILAAARENQTNNSAVTRGRVFSAQMSTLLIILLAVVN